MSMIHQSEKWAEELEILYSIIRSTDLVETTKWGGPCFTIHGKNVLGVGGFKSYLGIWFYQGVFLKDAKKVLVNAGEGKTKALRQWRFNSKAEIDQKLVKAYILEAIENAKAGKELKPEKKSTGIIPDELANALKKNKKLNAAFETLTPFKQREYINYISEAKQEKTRQTRAEKSIILIGQGKGLNDKYR
ncbi:MAG: YdeI/OmpD-associated family protein [Crocinitomicaceae bacterium]|nr:YdeI/OmpD-associated family protein [Crocinitomicaceae bacterium]MBK8925044.1 YdeI/OmpD-associated family protein [Crocinitomicaceae bacterium]